MIDRCRIIKIWTLVWLGSALSHCQSQSDHKEMMLSTMGPHKPSTYYAYYTGIDQEGVSQRMFTQLEQLQQVDHQGIIAHAAGDLHCLHSEESTSCMLMPAIEQVLQQKQAYKEMPLSSTDSGWIWKRASGLRPEISGEDRLYMRAICKKYTEDVPPYYTNGQVLCFVMDPVTQVEGILKEDPAYYFASLFMGNSTIKNDQSMVTGEIVCEWKYNRCSSGKIQNITGEPLVQVKQLLQGIRSRHVKKAIFDLPPQSLLGFRCFLYQNRGPKPTALCFLTTPYF